VQQEIFSKIESRSGIIYVPCWLRKRVATNRLGTEDEALKILKTTQELKQSKSQKTDRLLHLCCTLAQVPYNQKSG